MQAMAAMPGRIPLVVSGDLHATAEGRMLRSGQLDFSRNPVVAVLPGTLGTSTAAGRRSSGASARSRRSTWIWRRH